MGIRHDAREWAFQFLFQRDFNDEDLEVALADFWIEREAGDQAKAFTEELIKGVEENKEELDEVIQRHAEHWDLHRMGAVDRTVMRIGMYEMLHRPDIPPIVSINEAVDIAKDYSSRESGRFVNGILDRVRKELKRPARTAVEDERQPEEEEKA